MPKDLEIEFTVNISWQLLKLARQKPEIKPVHYYNGIMTSDNQLSDRELEILRLIATGASNKEIAQTLYISANTVKVHLRNIFSKIGVSSRTEAAMYAVNAGLTPRLSQVVEDTNQNAQTSEGMDSIVIHEPSAKPNLVLIAFVLVFTALAVIVFIFSRQNRAGQINIQNPDSLPQWQNLAPMPTSRSRYAAVVFDGKIYAIGGETSQGVTGIVEVYDPISKQWANKPTKPTAVSDVGAVVLGGKIYVPGGHLESGELTNILEIYDPQQNLWSQGTNLPVGISAYALATFEGKLYLFGGWDGKNYLSSVIQYDPGQDKWAYRQKMPFLRGYAGATTVGDVIYVIGGYDGKNALQDVSIFQPDVLDTSIRQWRSGIPLPTGIFAMGVTSLADNIYIIGGMGETSEPPPSLAFIVQSGEWRSVRDLPMNQVAYLGLTSLGSNLYAMGGSVNDIPVDNSYFYQAIYTISIPLIVK